MIQRVQTIYLFLVVVLSLVFMTGTIYVITTPSGQIETVSFMGSHIENGNSYVVKNIALITLTLTGIIVSLISIFLYKSRKIQLLLVAGASLLYVALTVLLLLSAMGLTGHAAGSTSYAFRIAIPFVNLMLLLMALRGIRKDEDLVKSYDRIR
jgi:hypothetical protein